MNYLVKVRHSNDIDGEQRKQEIITHGELSGDENDYTISYSESVDGTTANTDIRVLDGECVTVRRTSQMQTDMIIEVGKKHISEHKLPFGSFNLEVIGSCVKSNFGTDKSVLQFAYTTYQDNQVVNKAEFHITAKRKGLKL